MLSATGDGDRECRAAMGRERPIFGRCSAWSRTIGGRKASAIHWRGFFFLRRRGNWAGGGGGRGAGAGGGRRGGGGWGGLGFFVGGGPRPPLGGGVFLRGGW